MSYKAIELILKIALGVVLTFASVLIIFLVKALITSYTSPTDSFKYRLNDGTEGYAKYCYTSYGKLTCTDNDDHTKSVVEYWRNNDQAK